MNDDGSYTLSYPAAIPYADAPIADYALRVVLPEAASVVSVEVPFPHAISTSTRFTYLDGPWWGRPIVTAKANGTVVTAGTVGYNGDVRVTFTLPPGAMWFKPLYLFAAFLALFLAASILARLDCSLSARLPKSHTA